MEILPQKPFEHQTLNILHFGHFHAAIYGGNVFVFDKIKVLCHLNVLTGGTKAHVLNTKDDVSPASPQNLHLHSSWFASMSLMTSTS